MYICNYQRQWELSLDLKTEYSQKHVISIQAGTISSYMNWVLSKAERMRKCSSFFAGYQSSVILRRYFAESSYRTTSTLQPTTSSSVYLTPLFLSSCLQKNGEKQFSKWTVATMRKASMNMGVEYMFMCCRQRKE